MELGLLQGSGSGRDKEDWMCLSPSGPQLDGEWRLGVRERERERDWSDLVSISTEEWLFHHNATKKKRLER